MFRATFPLFFDAASEFFFQFRLTASRSFYSRQIGPLDWLKDLSSKIAIESISKKRVRFVPFAQRAQTHARVAVREAILFDSRSISRRFTPANRIKATCLSQFAPTKRLDLRFHASTCLAAPIFFQSKFIKCFIGRTLLPVNPLTLCNLKVSRVSVINRVRRSIPSNFIYSRAYSI